MKKRILSIIMVLSMCLSMLPTAAFAAEDTGLCEHHPEHTEECGWAEAVAGVDCTHEHTAECYTLGVLPNEDTDSNNAYELGDDAEQVNSLACLHEHNSECGYVEAVEGHDCHYECTECAAPACTCGSEDAVHATNCPAYVAPENPACFCAEKCTEDTLNVWCDVCGVQGVAACEGEDTATSYAFNSLTVGGVDALTNSTGSGWSYNASSSTLTITGNIGAVNATVPANGQDVLNITVTNNATVDGGIYAGGKLNLVVNSGVTLTVNNSGNNAAIQSGYTGGVSDSLTITGGGTVVATSSGNGNGIQSGGGLTIENVTVAAKGYNYGLHSGDAGFLYIKDNSKVYAVADTYAIYVGKGNNATASISGANTVVVAGFALGNASNNYAPTTRTPSGGSISTNGLTANCGHLIIGGNINVTSLNISMEQVSVSDSYAEYIGHLTYQPNSGNSTHTQKCDDGCPVSYTGTAENCSGTSYCTGTVCDKCGQTSGDGDSTKHKGGTATCTTKAKCELCQTEYGNLNSYNHSGSVSGDYTYVDGTYHSAVYSCCGTGSSVKGEHTPSTDNELICSECKGLAIDRVLEEIKNATSGTTLSYSGVLGSEYSTYNKSIEMEIPAGVTVNWDVEITGDKNFAFLVLSGSGTLNMTGTVINTSNNGRAIDLAAGSAVTLVIGDGGVVEGIGAAIEAFGGKEIQVNGGTVAGGSNGSGIFLTTDATTTVTVTAGTVQSTGYNAIDVTQASAPGTITISGGTVIGRYNGISAGNKGTVVVSGSPEISAQYGTSGASIYAQSVEISGTPKISSETNYGIRASTLTVKGDSHIVVQGATHGVYEAGYVSVSVADGGYYWFSGDATPTDLHGYSRDSLNGSDSGETYYELITKAHLEAGTIGDGTITCACNQTFSTTNCSGGEATCASGPVCTTCGIAYGAADSTRHVWGYTAEGAVITATCKNGCNTTATLTLTAPTLTTYGGTGSAAATITVEPAGALTAPTEITYTGSTNNGENYDNTAAPTDAGTYTASITVDGKTAQVTYTIAAKSIADATINLSATSGDYNGQPHAPAVTVAGLTDGTNYTVTFPTDMTNVGEKSITVRGMGNYTGTQTLTYTVNPIAPTAANFSFTAPSNLTYSGTAKEATVAPATGITGMGAVTVKYYKDGVETTPTNVGTYTVKISVAEGTNYTESTDVLTDATWTFTIGKATLTITADSKSMLTGKDLPTLTCSYSGFVNGETASVLTTQPSVTTTANGQTAGTFDITVSGAAATNYEISYVKGTLTVSDHVHARTYTADEMANTITAQCSAAGCPTPTQVITLAAPSGDLTYTGTAKEATVSGSIDGVATPTISYTGSLTDGKPVNAGSYTASITVEGKSVSVDIVIANASQTAPSVSAKNETIKGAADGGITGATADMEYSTTSGGTYAAIPEKLAAGTYYVRYKAKANYDPSPDTTVTIAAGPAIAVTFNVDGGTPAPNAQSLSYKEKVTKPTDPTKTDYEFLGWYNGDTAYDFNTEVTDASLTLTAKWKQVAFTVGVDIKDGENGMGGISVKLMKGSEVLHSGTTNSSGHIDFSHITAGAYNIVAVFDSGDAEQTRTALVTLTGDKTETINKPLEGANSHLAVTDDADTPAVVVGGLDTEAETLKTNDVEKVSVSMAVEGQKESEVQETVVESIQTQIQTDANLKDADPVVEYLNVTMSKAVTTSDGSTNESAITGTTNLIELVIPFPGGRKNPVVIRHHRDEHGNETAEKMTQNPSDGQEGFKVDGASETLHIYTKKFSTYAIAYTTEYTITFDPNGGDGGTTTGQTNSNGTVTLPTNLSRSGYTFKGWYTAASGGTQVTSSYVFSDDATIYAQWTQNSTGTNTGGGGGVSTYAITVEDANHGTVKSDRTRASYGSTVTISVTPDEGYKLGGLTVTDASGRKIEVTDKGNGTYSFKMPSGKVTVEASFVSDTAGAPCDGGADCPSAKFIDIDPNAWYHEALDYVIEHGLMGGYGNGYFGTNDALSRGMLARILYNLEGHPAVSGDMPFTDVAADRYYFDAILWAQRNGVAGGYGGGLFGPDDPITREQLAVMLWRYAGSPAATKKELDFTDADEAGSWAVDALIWAKENGIMQGNNNAVNPKGNASRSHVAQMLMRFIESVITGRQDAE